MDEILKISREINFNNLIYCFKGLGITSKNFVEFRGEKSIALSNLSIYYTWKNIKSS